MKVLERDAIARRAFREHGKNVPGAQAFRHLPHHPVRIAPRLALDVQGAGTIGQRADKRPSLDIGLGDKAAMACRMHHQNIQPRNMVGHQQDRAPGRG